MKKIFRLFAFLVVMGSAPIMTSCETIWEELFGSEDNSSGNNTPSVVHIAGVSIIATGLDNGEATLNIGSTLQLSADIYPAATSEVEVTWESGDISIATVSETGLVTAVKAGDTTVKVISKVNPAISATIIVHVIDGAVNINTDPVDQSTAEVRRAE